MWVIKLFSFSQKNLMKKGQRRAPKSHRERASHFLPAQLVVYSTGPGALGGHPLVDSSQLVTTQEAHGGYSPRDDNRFSQTQNVSHTQDPKSNPLGIPGCFAERKANLRLEQLPTPETFRLNSQSSRENHSCKVPSKKINCKGEASVCSQKKDRKERKLPVKSFKLVQTCTNKKESIKSPV
jgi:hypothetical protein